MNKYEAYSESIRLIHKYFPESKSTFTKELGIGIYNFITSMKFCDFNLDLSCTHGGSVQEFELSEKGGFIGDNDKVYQRLLLHSGFKPEGRCVIIPDVVSENDWESYSVIPIICDSDMVGRRLLELETDSNYEIFDGSSFDTLFVFESGEAMGVDHDNRFFWAKSKKRKVIG
ncbi:hypothetical protein [Flammeovirga sp. SJP92]|uniref:hypothetical protein n=1 Tax=Flammeovirga sp. SJP92 TaxID=1775430 RepID=UPI0007969A53|nr:hypothetical protein [Flammeovirga sp. SJP92]KXX67852.1 hypothetical protein AVL50_25675 [Flammeovirga sp. SJP92]